MVSDVHVTYDVILTDMIVYKIEKMEGGRYMQTRYGKRFAAGLMILTLIAAAVLPAGVLRAEAKERTAAGTLCGEKESCSEDEKPEIVSVQVGEDVYLLNVAVLENGGSSQMLSISGSFSGTLAGDFTYGTSLNGAYGSITAYFNGVSVKTFTYQIDTNGHIEEV